MYFTEHITIKGSWFSSAFTDGSYKSRCGSERAYQQRPSCPGTRHLRGFKQEVRRWCCLWNTRSKWYTYIHSN